MRHFYSVLVLAVIARGQTPAAKIPAEDAVRIREFYRLATQIEDQIWPDWSKVASPLLLVTLQAEFLTHHPAPPQDFRNLDNGFYTRSRRFPPNLLATFPAFGPPAVMVVGEPKQTDSKTSTPWIITLMHEHFHQLQSSQPGYFEDVENLGLRHGDETGMWMLNYPFPYEDPKVAKVFGDLRDLLLRAVLETENGRFKEFAQHYLQARAHFVGQLSQMDRKYFGFQLWQEGIARYTEIKVAEAAEQYQPTAEYAGLSDFTPFHPYAVEARAKTLTELKRADLAAGKRAVVYAFGAAEGLLLDRLHPKWKAEYFDHTLSMDRFFARVAA